MYGLMAYGAFGSLVGMVGPAGTDMSILSMQTSVTASKIRIMPDVPATGSESKRSDSRVSILTFLCSRSRNQNWCAFFGLRYAETKKCDD